MIAAAEIEVRMAASTAAREQEVGRMRDTPGILPVAAAVGGQQG